MFGRDTNRKTVICWLGGGVKQSDAMPRWLHIIPSPASQLRLAGPSGSNLNEKSFPSNAVAIKQLWR